MWLHFGHEFFAFAAGWLADGRGCSACEDISVVMKQIGECLVQHACQHAWLPVLDALMNAITLYKWAAMRVLASGPRFVRAHLLVLIVFFSHACLRFDDACKA